MPALRAGILIGIFVPLCHNVMVSCDVVMLPCGGVVRPNEGYFGWVGEWGSQSGCFVVMATTFGGEDGECCRLNNVFIRVNN